MKKYFLASVVVLASFLTGYFFALNFNEEVADAKPAQPSIAVTGQVMASGSANDCKCSTDKAQLAILKHLLSEKEQQLESHKQVLLTTQAVGNRYQVMMEALRHQGYFRGPRIQKNFQANEMFFKFFQLTPEEEQAIKEIGENTLLNIQDWEILNAYLLNKDDKKIVYEIPPGAEEIHNIKNQFIDDVVTVIGEENRELSHQFLGDLFEPFAFKRIITLQIIGTQDPAFNSLKFKLRVKMFDNNGQRRRSASNSTGKIPKRFNHLFNEFSFSSD